MTVGEVKHKQGQGQSSPSAPGPGSTNFPPSIPTPAPGLALHSSSHLCRRMITTVLLLQRLQSRGNTVSNSKERKSAWRPCGQRACCQAQSLLWGPCLITPGIWCPALFPRRQPPVSLLISSLKSMTWAQGAPGDHRKAGYSSICRYCNFGHSY